MSQQSQYRQSDDIVRKIRKILGNFAGYRALHADGRLYRGTFTANVIAKSYSRAPQFQGEELPVSVRFSKGGGDPFAHFSNTVGMGTRFYLPSGAVTHLVMLSQKLFVANTIEQFVGLLDAAMPAHPEAPHETGRPNVDTEGLNRFLAANPNSLAVFKMRAASPAPVSFAHTEFHAVHAFLLRNAANAVTPVRFHWIPVAGVKGQPIGNLANEAIDTLFVELEDRLERAPVEFDLQLELAQEGDPLDDATALWPETRQRVVIGRLTLSGPVTEDDIGDAVMNHDPTLLTDGIEATDDPILQIRRGVYEVSAAQRSGGWHKK